MKEKQNTPQNGQSGNKFDNLAHVMALHDIEDLMDRMLCPFILLGTTAKSCIEMVDLTGDKIEVGVKAKQFTKEITESIKVYKPEAVWNDNGISYKVDGLPVYIKIIHRNYKFFEYLDQRVYQYGDYWIPNPFYKYWKARFLIQ